MNDKNFDIWFNNMTDFDFIQWLESNLKDVILKNGQSYRIENCEDLKAVIEQELYEEKTGRC